MIICMIDMRVNDALKRTMLLEPFHDVLCKELLQLKSTSTLLEPTFVFLDHHHLMT